MKKFTALILAILTLLSLAVVPASADGEIRVFVDGTAVSFDQPPVIIGDRTLVPLRAIFEAMDATVSWDASTRTAIGKKDGTTVKITIDENVLYKDKTAITLDVSAKLIGGRTMVPARAISEAFGAYVSWNPAYRCVFVETQDEFRAKYLAKIGTHSETIAYYEASTQRQNIEVIYGVDKVNHLAAMQMFIDVLTSGTVVSSQVFGNIDNGTNAYYFSEQTIKPTDMDVWAYPAGRFVDLANEPDGQVLTATFLGEYGTVRAYRYTMPSGYVDYLFNPETAELDAIYVSPEASARLLATTTEPSIPGEKVQLPGAGDELYVFFEYDTNETKTVWDNIIEQIQ